MAKAKKRKPAARTAAARAPHGAPDRVVTAGEPSTSSSSVGLEDLAPEIPPEKKGGPGPGGRRPGAGRKPFRPTKEDRERVTLLAALIRHEDIPKLVFNPQTGHPIDHKTLRRHFRAELDNGKAKVDARVSESLVKRALDHSHPQGATCAIFYAKTRMGWRETTVLEVEGKAGVLVAPALVSVDAWLEKVKARNEKAVEPGLEEPE